MKTLKEIIDEETKAAIERGDIIVLSDSNLAVKREYLIEVQNNAIRAMDERIKRQEKQIQNLKKHLNLFICNHN